MDKLISSEKVPDLENSHDAKAINSITNSAANSMDDHERHDTSAITSSSCALGTFHRPDQDKVNDFFTLSPEEARPQKFNNNIISRV